MTSPVVAVLGTGTMGAGMVRSLRRADLPVRMWNRNPDRARALADTGARAYDAPDEAARGADVVLTMVLDTDAVDEVIRRAAPAAGTVWLQASTVGVDGVRRTIDTAEEFGLVLVDAPVLGTKEPAEKGALIVLASGPEEVRKRVAPVLDAIGSKTLWLGPAGAGSRMKLVCKLVGLHGHRGGGPGGRGRAGVRPGPARLPRRHRGRRARRPVRAPQERAHARRRLPAQLRALRGGQGRPADPGGAGRRRGVRPADGRGAGDDGRRHRAAARSVGGGPRGADRRPGKLNRQPTPRPGSPR